MFLINSKTSPSINGEITWRNSVMRLFIQDGENNNVLKQRLEQSVNQKVINLRSFELCLSTDDRLPHKRPLCPPLFPIQNNGLGLAKKKIEQTRIKICNIYFELIVKRVLPLMV